MSEELSVYEKIEQSPHLHAEILEVLEQMRNTRETPDWQALAADWGVSDINQEAVLAYGDRLMADDYELSNFELEMVAAGASTTCIDDGA